MGLVECIFGKGNPVGPYLINGWFIISVFEAAFKKFDLHLIHDGTFLFSHCFPQVVGFTFCESRQFL